MKKFLILGFVFLLSLITVFADENSVVLPSQIGKVVSVNYVDLDNEVTQVKQVAEIKLLKGEYKDKLVLVDNMLTDNPLYDINLKTGMTVLLHMEQTDEGLEVSVESVYRSNVLLILSLLFCALLVYVGKKKGFYSLVSIALTCVLIFHVLSPLVLLGVSPLLGTLIVCFLSTAITIYLVGGFNRKSTSAIIGTFLSIVFAGVLALGSVKLAHLSGFTDEYTMFLYSAHPELNFVGLVIAMIVLATLGAVMDVAMSIASTINEIYETDKTKTVKDLFNSGMNVGRDIIGTMANTLILVYLGSSLPLIFLANNIDIVKFFNLNQVVTEIASALIGSCAIVICVPITAIIASEFISKIPHKQELDNIEI